MNTSDKTLIVFQTRTGTTEKAASYLAENIKSNVSMVNLKKDSIPNLNEFSTILVGGSIRASAIQSGLKKFMVKNTSVLLEKKLGLFLCCMEEGATAEKQFNDSFPEELRKHATAIAYFGGEFDFDKLNFLERGIVKKVAGISESISKIDYKAIEKFATDIA